MSDKKWPFPERPERPEPAPVPVPERKPAHEPFEPPVRKSDDHPRPAIRPPEPWPDIPEEPE